MFVPFYTCSVVVRKCESKEDMRCHARVHMPTVTVRYDLRGARGNTSTTTVARTHGYTQRALVYKGSTSRLYGSSDGPCTAQRLVFWIKYCPKRYPFYTAWAQTIRSGIKVPYAPATSWTLLLMYSYHTPNEIRMRHKCLC